MSLPISKKESSRDLLNNCFLPPPPPPPPPPPRCIDRRFFFFSFRLHFAGVDGRRMRCPSSNLLLFLPLFFFPFHPGRGGRCKPPTLPPLPFMLGRRCEAVLPSRCARASSFLFFAVNDERGNPLSPMLRLIFFSKNKVEIVFDGGFSACLR